MSYWIRLNGIPANLIAPHSAPTWETLADGGNGAASWEMGKSAKFQHQALAPDSLAEILLGPKRVWFGRIDDYDRLTGAVAGRGIHTDTLGIPAFDSGGNPTRLAAAALTTAVAPPWSWQMVDPEGHATAMGSAAGDDTSPMMLHSLLDQIAAQNGKRWGQDASGALYYRSDPTVPTWLVAPETAAFGTTGEGAASHLVGQYDSGGGVLSVVRGTSVGAARAEVVDLTGRGVMSEAQVVELLDNALAQMKPRYSWVNGVEIPLSRVTTMGGTPAHGASVRAGTMVQAHGFATAGSFSSLVMRDVIGKTRYTAGASSIYIEPVDVAPRTFTDVIAAS